MKNIFLMLVALVFVSCSTKNDQVSVKTYKNNLLNTSQNVEFYTKELDATSLRYAIQKKYKKKYFSVWNDDKPRDKLSVSNWTFRVFKAGNSYGENLQLLSKDFFDEMLENSDFDNYGTLNKNAITLSLVDIRAFPTSKVLLRDPAKAGEGFPFDYLQNSSLGANKPIFVSHYSKDRAWVYIFSSFTSGWIESSKIVFLKKKYTDKIQKAQQIYIIKENIPLYGKDKEFLFYSRIGVMLPLISEDSDSYTVLAISKHRDAKPYYQSVKLSKSITRKKALRLDRDALSTIMNEVIKSKYGWGGSYGQRDCSSSTRDLYAPFGIWLPRNSSQQAKVGRVIKLENLSDDEKIATIKKEGVPFQTLLYKQGHIVLYVGVVDDEIIIFHNVWGIKTKKDGVEGRKVIGKTIFSTLRLGENTPYNDEEAQILKNLKSMNILTQ